MADSATLERPVETPAKGGKKAAAEKISMEFVLIAHIGPGTNPRSRFDADKLSSLAASIETMGVIEPIVIRPTEAGAEKQFSIIAGERRYRAALQAGLEKIPAVIRQVSETEALEMTIEENMERDQLNAIEEAQGFMLLGLAGRTQQQIAERLHKSQPFVANRLRLLQLPTTVQDGIIDGQISHSHGVSLASVSDRPDFVQDLYRRVIQESMSVSTLDDIIRMYKQSEAEAAQPRLDVEPEAAPVQMIEPGPEPTPDSESSTDVVDNTDPFAEVTEPEPVQLAESETVVEPELVVISDTQQAAPVPEATPVKPSTPAPATVVNSTPAPKPQAPPQAPQVAPVAPVAPAPKGIPGYTTAMVKEADYQILKDRGLWPLSAIIEALDGVSAVGLPQSVAAPAEKLARMNQTQEGVFTAQETDILNRIFPARETTTSEHVLAVLAERRIEALIDLDRKRDEAATAGEATEPMHLTTEDAAPSMEVTEESEAV